RTTADELRAAADVIAQRLNQARGPWTFLVPLQGWSSLDKPGRPIFDPEADAAFVARLKQKLSDPTRVKEVDMHLYTSEFARAAVDEFVRLFESARGARRGRRMKRRAMITIGGARMKPHEFPTGLQPMIVR